MLMFEYLFESIASNIFSISKKHLPDEQCTVEKVVPLMSVANR